MLKHVFASDFFWLFLIFYVVHEIVHIGLELLNLKRVTKQKDVPLFYKDKVTKDTFLKSKSYTINKIKFSLILHVVGIPFFWMLILMGGFKVIDELAFDWSFGHGLTHSVLFCLLIGVYFYSISLPFKIYHTFVIEEEYGFNKVTPKLFVIDQLKSIVVSLVIGVPVLYLVFWFMVVSGKYWWVWVWAFLSIVQLFMMAIYPAVLAPIFNKFKPLEEGELKEAILNLVKKIKFKIAGIFVMDGSRRSAHSNAYFAGLGRFRRVVLFDTLMEQLSVKELVAVLAHEIGHNKKQHITRLMVLSVLFMLFGFWVMSLLITWEPFYDAFNIYKGSLHAAFIVFAIAFETFTFMLTPIMNFMSRKFEYEADKFSYELTGDKESMVSALFKLTNDNLSNLTPHKAYSFYHYSHPVLEDRVGALRKIE